MGGFSFGIPLSFGGVTLTPDQIAAAVAAQTGQPAQTLTQAVTATPTPTPRPTATVPANATGIAAQELTGDPDMDRQILAARDAQGVSVDVGAGSLTPEEYQQATEELAAYRNLPENRAYRDTRRPELAALASGLLSLAVPVVAPQLAASTGLTAALGAGAGSAVTGAALGGTLAAAQGDSIVEGVLTGGGLPLDANITNVLGGPTQAVVNTVSAPLAAVSAAGPAVMGAEQQDDDLAGLDLPVVDAVVGGAPVILDQPPTYVEPVDQQEPEAGGGGGGSSAGGATAPTGGAAAQTDGEVQGGVSDAQTGAQAGSEVTEGVDPVVANQILEAILSETDQNVRDGLISDWQNYTGETFDNTLLPDYQEQAPPEPVGYVWGDGVWTPVFDIPPAGSVIFEPGAQQPDYTPQEDEVVDVTGDLIDAAGGLLDSTIDADTTADIEPVDTTTVEPVDTTTVEPVDTTTEGVESGATGGDQSVDVGGEGTGDGTGVGSGVGGGEGSGEGNGKGDGQGDGEGDGSGDGTGMGAGMMAAAAGAAFEPKWTELFKYTTLTPYQTELFKYTTLTPYQKKAIAPYVDYIAQARGMLS
jgi:hypothetical protein